MQAPRATTVAILCGGRGTRLQEHTRAIPKPLVEIGSMPILWHVMRIYACQGVRRFVLCLGYKRELLEEFVASSDWPPGTEIHCVDTGLDTQTGGRIKRAASYLPADEAFHVTYADGVADIDLGALEAFHRRQATLATVTVVRPQLPFGVARIGEDGRIEGFQEKPRSDHWINGGFFVFEPGALDYLEENSILERGPLEALAADAQLSGYRHGGFWDCMDTYKDALLLNDLWVSGRVPWRVWEPGPLQARVAVS